MLIFVTLSFSPSLLAISTNFCPRFAQKILIFLYFSIFENQAFKRLAFYKKKNYEITTTKVEKDGKVLSSYSYSTSEEIPVLPKTQRRSFGFSKLKQAENK